MFCQPGGHGIHVLPVFWWHMYVNFYMHEITSIHGLLWFARLQPPELPETTSGCRVIFATGFAHQNVDFLFSHGFIHQTSGIWQGISRCVSKLGPKIPPSFNFWAGSPIYLFLRPSWIPASKSSGNEGLGLSLRLVPSDGAEGATWCGGAVEALQGQGGG